jgi:heptosyltransferase I
MKIAIVKLSALGDIIHAMLVLQFIKKHNQDIKIDWVVEESYKQLLEFHPDINKVHTVNLKRAKKKKSLFLLFKEIKRVRQFGRYDLVIDMQGLVKSALISHFISSTNTLGFDKFSARESFASMFYSKTFHYNYKKNIIERNFEIIKFALGLKSSKVEILKKLPFLYPRDKYFDNTFSNIKKNIILIPGASHISKCFPVSKFIELISLLDANFVIIWGDLTEKKLAENIKTTLPDVTVCNKLDLKELILLINQADLVIGPDTGPTHMAWALNKPSITLFGPTPGYRNSYVTAINKTIDSRSIVNPMKINHSDDSIKTIDINEVVKISQLLLELK